MKKNILKVALVATFALIAGYTVYTSQKSVDLSALALDNVEALASETGSKDCQTYCQVDYRYTCFIMYGSGIDGITCPEHRKKSL